MGGGFGRVHEWKERSVDSGKEDIGAPADSVDHDGRDHDDDKVEKPIRDGRDGVGLPAGAEGIDFRGVQLRVISAGVICGGEREVRTHGSGSQVAPKDAIYKNRPAAAPLAAPCVPGMRQQNVIVIAVICPIVPSRNSLRRPARSMMNQEVVAKMAYTTMLTPPMIKLMSRVWPIDSWNRIGK